MAQLDPALSYHEAKLPRHRPFFLSRFSRFSAFWGSSGFGRLNRFFLVFLARNMLEPRFFICSVYLPTTYLREMR